MASSENEGESKEFLEEQEEDVKGEVVDKEDVKEESKDRKISFSIVAFLITVISVGAKFALIIFDIFVPRALREYVPFFNMTRKITLPISEIMAGKKSKEISEVANELDELDLRGQKVMKAYPLRRTIGQAMSMGISPIILVLIPSIIWGEGLVNMIKDKWPSLPTAVIIIGLGTIMLIISWIATLFGPIYVVFHNSSKYLLKMGAYRWASIYQDLENFFAIPYYAAKSSFSFFDAPPISSETLDEFKLDIREELDEVKEKVESLLSLDNKHVPERSKKELEKLLNKIDIPLTEFDLAKVKDSTSRTFALLIWAKEVSILPWRRNEALERFAIRNRLTIEEAEEVFYALNRKRKAEGLKEETIKSVLITGALKGINQQEEKYNQIMADIESNKLAISLALGTEQYLEDIYRPLPKFVVILKAIGVSLLAILMPFLLIILAVLLYIKHLLFTLVKTIFSKGTFRIHKYIGKRYSEIKENLIETYQSVKQKGKEFSFKEDINFSFKKFFLSFGKLFLKFLLFLIKLVTLWPFWKSLYVRIIKLIQRRKPENRMRRMFEKELTTESLVFMYQEIYEKLVV
ncbi:MAG: hypothetical protein GPJ51_07425 [Candidatus Heimdallarchaeota archaeon]|nr:hypothetical protein [Candidatus Heimdallarchaeota archaeon]